MGHGPVVLAQRGAGCTHPPLLPQGTWCERVNDRKVLSDIIHATWSGYNRFRRWSDKEVFDLIFSELSVFGVTEPSGAAEPDVLMIDATDPQAHHTASALTRGF